METVQLAEICKQLKLAHIGDILAKADDNLKSFARDLFAAEIEGLIVGPTEERAL